MSGVLSTPSNNGMSRLILLQDCADILRSGRCTDIAKIRSLQVACLNVAYDSELRFGGARGAFLVLDQLEAISLAIKDWFLMDMSMTLTGPNLDEVISCKEIHGIVTRTTLRAFFPDHLSDEPLVQRLIGRSLRLKVTSHMYFNQSRKVQELVVDVEFRQAFEDILLDPLAVIALFDQSRLAADGTVQQEHIHEIIDIISPNVYDN
jgi:hypothetical protein